MKTLFCFMCLVALFLPCAECCGKVTIAKPPVKPPAPTPKPKEICVGSESPKVIEDTIRQDAHSVANILNGLLGNLAANAMKDKVERKQNLQWRRDKFVPSMEKWLLEKAVKTVFFDAKLNDKVVYRVHFDIHYGKFDIGNSQLGFIDNTSKLQNDMDEYFLVHDTHHNVSVYCVFTKKVDTRGWFDYASVPEVDLEKRVKQQDAIKTQSINVNLGTQGDGKLSH